MLLSYCCSGKKCRNFQRQIIRIALVYDIDLEKAFIEAREDEKRYLESREVRA